MLSPPLRKIVHTIKAMEGHRPMTSSKLALVAALGAMLLTACESYVQSTSGEDYLARYDGSYTPTAGTGSDVDADVRKIAAVEPDIRFPARIGLARIENGQLISVPADEAYIWQELAADLGPLYGEFVPVSPLIANMVRPSTELSKNRHWRDPANAIADIRRGAARQHIDYVLAYEVGSSTAEKANALALADLTVIGMFVLPSRTVDVEASASGILLDVRNGYPYATVTAHAEKGGLARAVSEYSKARELADTAEELAVLHLSDDVKTAMGELAKRATLKPSAEPTPPTSSAWWEED